VSAVRRSTETLVTEGGEPRLRDLRVMLRGIEARADAPDHLAIDDDRKASLHLDESVRRHSRDAAMIDRVLEPDLAS
jgi:hypothetical protein